MARKIVKKKANEYGNSFVKVADYGDSVCFIRHFGSVGTRHLGDIELVVVAEIMDLEDAVSESELPADGNFQLDISIVPYEKYIAKKHKDAANDENQSSSDNTLVNIVSYMGGLNYQPNKKAHFKTREAAEKYLRSKELNDVIDANGIMSGFVMDKHYNRAGQSNWDRLAYMTGESNKFEKGGSVKKRIIKKKSSGDKDIDANSTSGTKIPNEVYFKGKRYFGKAGFINGFNGYTSTKDDGMLCAFTQEKGYQKEKLSLWNGSKPNYLTDKEGSNIMSKNYRGQSVTFEENGVRHFAKGGSVNPKKIKKRLEEIRKELRGERISYGELSELQSLAKYIDKDDVELLEAAGVPEFPEEEFEKGSSAKKRIIKKKSSAKKRRIIKKKK